MERTIRVKQLLQHRIHIQGKSTRLQLADMLKICQLIQKNQRNIGLLDILQRKRYAELTARYEKSKAKYDDIAEQIESKKAKRELFKGFIRTLEKQDGITYEFDAGIWSSLVQEVIVKSKDDIRFMFKNGFEVRVQKQDLMELGQ